MTDLIQIPIMYNIASVRERRSARIEHRRQQNHKCWYCDANLDDLPPDRILDMDLGLHLFPRGFFRNREHLHHDHKTGMSVGAVHSVCNAILWQYHGE